MGKSLDKRLEALVDVIDQLRSSFDGIAVVAREAGNASGVEFAVHMLNNSLDSFEGAVIRYVSRSKDATKEGI